VRARGNELHLSGSVRPPLLAGRFLAVVLLATGCAPRILNQAAPTATASAPRHAPEIRFALIGEVGDQNVWALFDGENYSYNTYAVRAAYWPRLYGLSVPGHEFEILTADGPPGKVQQEGAFFTATVPVSYGLRWSDGNPFTAGDVAFTINTALAFELDFDWGDYYASDLIDHAEATTPDSVRFFFNRAPGIAAWQYGALQGPVVQQDFWSSRVAAAAALLPSEEARADIDALRIKIADLQAAVDRLYREAVYVQGEQARELQADLRRQQGNLDEASNDLAEAQGFLQSAMEDARQSLFEQDDAGEPLLGSWLPVSGAGGGAADSTFTNVPNPDFPRQAANFDRASYHAFATREAALQAMQAGKIDVLLEASPGQIPDMGSDIESPTRSLRFLLLNTEAEGLADAALRRALACVIDQGEIAASLPGRASALTSAVPREEGPWHEPGALLPCAGLDREARLAAAVDMLKNGGYTWEREPAADELGQGLQSPDGSALARLALLVPGNDEARLGAAEYVVQEAVRLGLPITLEPVTANAVDYAVLSSGEYELAILGWKAAAFPGYLCDWFNAGGALSYSPSALPSQCGALAASSDLDQAYMLVRQMQVTLAGEIPIVPLFSTVVREAIRNVSYPFPSILDGVGSVFGAPGLAIPTIP